jgi:hypothetical protein
MLYFAYSATLDPELLSTIAPNAKFLYIAHLPEAKLVFPTPDGRPSVRPASGNTVWGAIFEVDEKESAAIEKAEAAEGRAPRHDLRAVDRAGNKYEVVTYCHSSLEPDHTPDPKYMEQVVRGARHWSLPTGWVAGLEDLGEDALI